MTDLRAGDAIETVGSAVKSRRVYAYTVPGNSSEPWSRTAGETTIRGIGRIKVGDTTRSTARERIKEQLGTAFPNLIGVEVLLDEVAVRKDGSTFRDYDVHRALSARGYRRSGGEWFECTLEELRACIAALRSGGSPSSARTQDFGMRPEQENAVAMTAGYFRSHADQKRKPHFLWNAKMRFGKTFTTYQLAKEMGWSRVLILTYKPAVHSAWKDDLVNHVDFSEWRFVDRDTAPEELDGLADGNVPLVWFASFQDISGRDANGAIKSHNENLHLIKWDCIVIDEYHFGAWRSSARDLYDSSDRAIAEVEEPDEEVTEADLDLASNHYLYLSGTPFRAITNGEFTEDQVFNWTYIDEQRAKSQWGDQDGESPYADLPKIEMYTYRISESADRWAADGEFNGFSLNDHFRAHKVEGGGALEFEFEDEKRVFQFLEMIRGSMSDTMKSQIVAGTMPPFPYSDLRFAGAVRDTVWYMNDIAACHAMKALLEEHPYFSSYEVHVAAGSRAGLGAAAKRPVERAIVEARASQKSGTITLSCGKLMTGVTIREWSAILMLRSLKSPESYFQAAFRVQSPWSVSKVGLPKEVLKPTCYVFEFDPNRALSLVAEYGTRLAATTESSPSAVLGELINYLPIFAFDGGRMSKLDANEVLAWAAAGIGATALAARWNSPLLVDVTEATLSKLLARPELLASLEQVEDFRNLTRDADKIVTLTRNLKAVKRQKGDVLGDSVRPDRKENALLRKALREKLQKFVARVPIFMYLTDFREEALVHVIQSLDPALFERVTGLTIGDFKQLSAIGVFNSQHMDYAIYQFRQFENASLVYASEVLPVTSGKVGLWTQSVTVRELEAGGAEAAG